MNKPKVPFKEIQFERVSAVGARMSENHLIVPCRPEISTKEKKPEGRLTQAEADEIIQSSRN